MMKDTPIEYIVIVIIGSLTSIFLVGGIVSFFFTNNKTVVYELVLYLSISSTFSMISYMLPWYRGKEKIECLIQSFLMVIFEASQFLWSMIIGYHISKGIKLYRGEKEVLSMARRFIYYLICFFLPIVLGIVSYVLGQMGNSGVWCWILGGNISGQMLQWVSFILAYAAAILNLSFSIRLIIYFNREKSIAPEEAEAAKGLIYKLIRFPIIQIITIIPATVNRVYTKITGETNVVLGDISIFFECFQGTFIIITYWINKGSLTYLTQCCNKKEETLEKEFIQSENRIQSVINLEEFNQNIE